MGMRIAVVGATGRMGRLVADVVRQTPDLELALTLHSGDDLGRVAEADAVVDVTLPQVSPNVVRAAVRAGKPVLVGTSGWSATRISGLRAELPKDAPGILIVPNFSIGSVLATVYAEHAAAWFEWIEIIEAHHANKPDSPSGTAVRTAERMAAARAEHGPVRAPHADQRARGQQVAGIPVHALRMEGIVARQDVLLGGPGETLTLRHDTIEPVAYEAGVRAALRALPQVSGIVVGLESVLFGEGDGLPQGPSIRDAPSGQAAGLGAP